MSKGCDPSSYYSAFRSEPKHVSYYRAVARNFTFSSDKERGGCNANITVPPVVLEAVLKRAVRVRGDPERYKYECIDFHGVPSGARQCHAPGKRR